MKTNDIIEDKLYEVLPIKNTVLFPGVLLPVAVSRKNSLKLIKAANKNDTPILVLTQKDNSVSDPGEQDLYALGTYARVVQIIPIPEMGENHVMAVLEGIHRVQAYDFQESEKNILLARANVLDEEMPLKNDKQFFATVDSIRETILHILSNRDNSPVDLQMTIRGINNSPTLVNYICAVYHMMPTEKKTLLLAYIDLR